MNEDLDSLKVNIDYVQENILELQNNLIAVDDSKVSKLHPRLHVMYCTCMYIDSNSARADKT